MSVSLVRSTLATLILLTFMSRASADSPADIARDRGLLGTWAVNCAKPAKQVRGNVISYEIGPSGELVYWRDNDVDDINTIIAASVAPDDTLTLSIEMPQYKQVREFGVAMEPDHSIRTLFNRGADGSYTIRDGRFVGNGKPTPRLRKCE